MQTEGNKFPFFQACLEGSCLQLPRVRNANKLYLLPHTRALRATPLQPLKRIPPRPSLEHSVDQALAPLETVKIMDEVFHDPQRFIRMSAAGMRSDEAVRRRPQRMIGGQRFRSRHIEVNRRKVT